MIFEQFQAILGVCDVTKGVNIFEFWIFDFFIGFSSPERLLMLIFRCKQSFYWVFWHFYSNFRHFRWISGQNKCRKWTSIYTKPAQINFGDFTIDRKSKPFHVLQKIKMRHRHIKEPLWRGRCIRSKIPPLQKQLGFISVLTSGPKIMFFESP